jgi:hypothetical protein
VALSKGSATHHAVELRGEAKTPPLTEWPAVAGTLDRANAAQEQDMQEHSQDAIRHESPRWQREKERAHERVVQRVAEMVEHLRDAHGLEQMSDAAKGLELPELYDTHEQLHGIPHQIAAYVRHSLCNLDSQIHRRLHSKHEEVRASALSRLLGGRMYDEAE